jgi:hypothetical protein
MSRIAGESHVAQTTIFIILKTKSTSTWKCDVGQLKSVFNSETFLNALSAFVQEQAQFFWIVYGRENSIQK